MKKKFLSLCLTLSMTAVLLFGCGSKDTTAAAGCPFSDLEWGSNVKDMEAAEGTEHETYDSVYGGTTYTYAKEYQGLTGTVKYMFDENEKLASIAWAYGSDDADELRLRMRHRLPVESAQHAARREALVVLHEVRDDARRAVARRVVRFAEVAAGVPEDPGDDGLDVGDEGIADDFHGGN